MTLSMLTGLNDMVCSNRVPFFFAFTAFSSFLDSNLIITAFVIPLWLLCDSSMIFLWFIVPIIFSNYFSVACRWFFRFVLEACDVFPPQNLIIDIGCLFQYVYIWYCLPLQVFPIGNHNKNQAWLYNFACKFNYFVSSLMHILWQQEMRPISLILNRLCISHIFQSI